MINIKHEPVIDIKELANELNILPEDFSFFNDPTNTTTLSLTTEYINSLKNEILIIEEAQNPENDFCSMLYDPDWIRLYTNDLAAINLLRNEYGLCNYIIVRKP